jgi:hypothetical protein
VTQLRKMMLDELQRRNYAQSTVEAYITALREFAAYFKRPPDQLGPEHIRQFQLYLIRDRKLAINTVKQRIVLLANWDLTDIVGVAHFPSIPPDRGVIGIARLHALCFSNPGGVAT